MEPWEIISSIVVFIGILLFAVIFHALNKWKRWEIVESESIRRVVDQIPAGDIPPLEVIRYEYLQGSMSPAAPLVVLLSPSNKYRTVLDQYATALCLADYPVILLGWKQGRGDRPINFANIVSRVSTLTSSPHPMTFFLVFRSVTREIIPSVSCAAKNPRNQWILISPEIDDFGKWEIFSGNGNNIRVLYSLNSPKRYLIKLQAFIAKLKIPAQNLAPFPIGGLNLAKQETVSLAKIISWISVKP